MSTDADHSPPIVLMPGQWAIRWGQGVIETLLGSCVALTLWDPLTLTGACCHFILPEEKTRPRSAEKEGAAGKFGRAVVPLMWAELAARGIPRERCVHKLFGGGRMFAPAAGDIGADNIACVRALVDAAGITLAAESVGGDGHRRISFDVATGVVAVQFHPVSPAFCEPTP
ncbi:chemotaxis protein CheD [Aquimonas voraii]|uniref:Probable chemoreceptor glutamine deamidase CheD n=1 Tax=Aquimonas voraii TaxID=265719 RepID=A0A1G6ZI45_9GAMM|nr:chemotaxis protein CheD [Aquimonas voraii]SDE02103.1 chemotaxis protein CheD [Aquimonas voraii]